MVVVGAAKKRINFTTLSLEYGKFCLQELIIFHYICIHAFTMKVLEKGAVTKKSYHVF